MKTNPVRFSSFAQTFPTFVAGFLNTCLLSIALMFLLVGSNMAVTRLLAYFA